MSTYLELVNKVIHESSSEKDPLDDSTWLSLDAGRRIYPRIKRNVADAWKQIQMRRSQWEFMSDELSTIVYPRMNISNGIRAAGAPSVGDTYRGATSGFLLTIVSVVTTGDWTTGGVEGYIEFSTTSNIKPSLAEEMIEVTPIADDGVFVNMGRGSYAFTEINPRLRNIQWSTFVASTDNSPPRPVFFIPWDKWTYSDFTYTVSSVNYPTYVSQDNKGNVVFYPQVRTPFRINFIHDMAPQILGEPTDVPEGLPAEYHDWIAWEALMKFAMFDKNPQLYSYAKTEADTYAKRAEANLMPLVSYASSPFNDGRLL